MTGHEIPRFAVVLPSSNRHFGIVSWTLASSCGFADSEQSVEVGAVNDWPARSTGQG